MNKEKASAPVTYTAPSCRELTVRIDRNFLASGDFGSGGYPGDDLDPGDEFNF